MSFRIAEVASMSAGELGLEGVAGEIAVDPAAVGQRLLPGLGGRHLLDVGGDRRLLLVGEAGRRGDHAPVLQRHVDAGLLAASGASTPASRSSPETASSAQLAGLDLAGELAVAGDADGHLAAEDRRQRLAAAGEGDVVDLGRIDARPPWRSARRGCGRRRRPSRRPRRPRPDRPSASRRGRPWSGCRLAAGTTIASCSPVSRAIGVTMREVDRRGVGQDRADHDVAADDQRPRGRPRPG